MTWLGGWAVTGGTNSAAEARLMLQASTRASQGVVETGDLKVTETGTPSSSVQVAAGACVIKGVEVNFQGSYSGVNAGVDTLAVPASGASATHHLIIARAEDPTFSGSPWTTDLGAGAPVVRAVLVPDVAAGTTTVPAGTSGIPLARIDMPASTATVTDDMIVDLRSLADPRRERLLLTEAPATASTAIGASLTWSYFDTANGWNIAVPSWAARAIIKVDVSPIRYDLGFFFGQVGASFGASINVQPSVIDDNQGSGIRRVPTTIGDTVAIPSAYRGTTQLLRVRAAALETGQVGRIQVDSGTTLIADVQFEEAPQ